MAGIILGALGGAGQEAAKFGGRMQQGAIDADLENLRSENLQNRTIALEKARISMNNQEREAGVARVNQAQTGLVNQAKAAKLNQFYGEGSNLRPEDISDEEMASPQAQLSGAETADARTKAAISTGDISPKDAAALGQKDAKTQAQLELGMAKLEAAINKANGGNKDQTNKEMLSLLDGMRKDIASESADVKNSMKAEINGLGKFAEPDEVKKITDAYAPKLEAMNKRRKQIQKDFNVVRERIGLPPINDGNEDSAESNAKPATESDARPAAVLPSLPSGSKKIGTSNGKDVYQAPDGKRYISQ
jgi:hypothetical protein